MKAKVYIETSVVSYLAARPSRDLIVAAQQQLSQAWWHSRRTYYDLFVSELVLQESERGDPEVAARRLALVNDLPLLAITERAIRLAEIFLTKRHLPQKAEADALHIAIATVHRMDYLLTWNCRHIANAEIQRELRSVTEQQGVELPILCTPNELMGGQQDVE